MTHITRFSTRLACPGAPAAAVLLVVLAAVAAFSTTHAARVLLHEATGFYVVPNTAIQGQDIDCGQSDYDGKRLSYCRICSGLTAAATACQNNPSCEALVADASGGCVYLKRSGAPTYYTPDFATYLTTATTSPTVPSAAPAGAYSLTLRQALPNQEIDCGKKDYNGATIPYCRVCGGINALVAACDAAPGCVAFDMEDSNSCGYLKTGSAGTYTEGTNSYTKA